MHEQAEERSAAVYAPAELVARCRGACRLALRATGHAVVEFYRSNNLTFAGSIAYYSLLSMFPFLLLVLSILSRLAIANRGSGQEALQHLLGRTLPANLEFVGDRLQELATAPLNFSLLGTVVTLWASAGVFGAITSAVNHAWGVERSYGFFKHKLVAFLMMLAAGLLAIVALVLMSAVQVIEANWFSSVVIRYPQLWELTGFVYRHLATPLSILVVGLVYYFIPNAPVRLRDVWWGAIVAGVLWQLAFAGFAWYVRDLSRFSVHGSVAAVVVFLIWVYLSAVILLYGVEITAAYARLRKQASTT